MRPLVSSLLVKSPFGCKALTNSDLEENGKPAAETQEWPRSLRLMLL